MQRFSVRLGLPLSRASVAPAQPIKLPATIGKNECLAHFHKIAPEFAKEKGFIRKQFIWSENSIAGGVYQWETLADAKAFHQGPWLDGILSRYSVYPEITFAVAEQSGEVIYMLVVDARFTPESDISTRQSNLRQVP